MQPITTQQIVKINNCNICVYVFECILCYVKKNVTVLQEVLGRVIKIPSRTLRNTRLVKMAQCHLPLRTYVPLRLNCRLQNNIRRRTPNRHYYSQEKESNLHFVTLRPYIYIPIHFLICLSPQAPQRMLKPIPQREIEIYFN